MLLNMAKSELRGHCRAFVSENRSLQLLGTVHICETKLSGSARSRCALNHACFVVCLLLWKHLSPSLIAEQSTEKTQGAFLRCVSDATYHFVGFPSAKMIYLLQFTMETLANMFISRTANQKTLHLFFSF